MKPFGGSDSYSVALIYTKNFGSACCKEAFCKVKTPAPPSPIHLNYYFLLEHCHHLRSRQLRHFPASWSSSEEPAAEGPHDAGAALECRQSHSAVRWGARRAFFIISCDAYEIKISAWRFALCFDNREDSQVEPGHGARIRLPHFGACRRAEICVDCCQKIREPGKVSLHVDFLSLMSVHIN